MNLRKNYFKILCSASFCFAIGLTGCGGNRDSGTSGDSSSSTSLAPNEFLVTFNTKGGTAVADQVISSGGTVTKPQDPTQEYYTFTGWYWDFEEVTPFDFEGVTIQSNTTIYAGWTPDHTASGLDNEPAGGGGGGGGGEPVVTAIREITEKWAGSTYVYLWKGAGGEGNQNAPWPGVKLEGTPSSTGPGGNNFSVDLGGYEKIILHNNNGTQSADTALAGLLSQYANGLYYDGGTIKGW